ncbi:hypothetical protein [Microvirgula curvata]
MQELTVHGLSLLFAESCKQVWDGPSHQATIESTQSKRCGLLRTIANSIEKPAGLQAGKQVFLPCWSP